MFPIFPFLFFILFYFYFYFLFFFVFVFCFIAPLFMDYIVSPFDCVLGLALGSNALATH